MDVGATDAAVRDLDVEVGGGEGFGGEGRPGHGAFGGIFVVAEPTVEGFLGPHSVGLGSA